MPWDNQMGVWTGCSPRLQRLEEYYKVISRIIEQLYVVRFAKETAIVGENGFNYAMG